METGAAASLAAINKTNKYCQLSATHNFTPVAIETTGTWHRQAAELVQELGRRATIVTGDSRETTNMLCGVVSEHVHSQLVCCNQLLTFLNFNI